MHWEGLLGFIRCRDPQYGGYRTPILFWMHDSDDQLIVAEFDGAYNWPCPKNWVVV